MQGDYTGLLGNEHGKYPDGPILSRIEGDKRDIQYNRGTLQPTELDLSSAQAPREFDFQGDVLYVDKLSTGTLKFRFDTSWQRGFPLGANSAVRGFPYKSVLLEWDSQPGKTVVIWHGYGLEIVPPNQDITAIGSITNPVKVEGTLGVLAQESIGGVDTLEVRERGFAYGASFGSTAFLAANTPETVIAPGTNTGGVIVWSAGMRGMNSAATNITSSLLAKASAPANFNDGAVLLIPDNYFELASTRMATAGKLVRPVFLAAGLGLYFISGALETQLVHRHVLYTVLP